MTEVYISLGSNIEPERNMERAVVALGREVKIRMLSTVYLTRPLERSGQPDFYNCVALIETDRSARSLKFDILRGIERSLGRKRTEDRFAPRTIDLDILLYDREEIRQADLVVPDPEIYSRPFLARSLSEISPGLRLPGHGGDVDAIARKLGTRGMEAMPSFTEKLRSLVR